MTNARRSRRKAKQARNFPLEKGLQVGSFGIVMLVISAIYGQSTNPMLGAFAKGVRTPAWIALAIGCGLLAVAFGVHKLGKKAGDGVGQRIEPNDSAAELTALTSAPTKATAWTSKVFDDIEWRRFEAVVEALFGQAGFETRTQSHGADGGVDVWLYSRNNPDKTQPASIVQCKHWRGNKPVGVKEMREFFGVMSSHGLKRGTYATSGRYSDDAKTFAKSNGIHLLDTNGLLKLIASRTPEQQAALLAVAYEGEYWKPTCASCGVKMVERTPKKGGAAFWGCANYPRCKQTLR